MAESTDDLGIPGKNPRSAVSPGAPPNGSDESRLTAAPPTNTPSEPSSTPTFLRAPLQPTPPIAQKADRPPMKENVVEPRKLIVGEGITLSGQINACDRLLIEGTVEANLQACQNMLIAETGAFNGTATIDDAEIYGRFDGELAVRKRLLIRAGGQVCGTISYGQIEIEPGGRISGSIQTAQREVWS